MTLAPERAEQKRREKLECITDQVENGQVIIPQVNAEERRHCPSLSSDAKRPAKG